MIVSVFVEPQPHKDSTVNITDTGEFPVWTHLTEITFWRAVHWLWIGSGGNAPGFQRFFIIEKYSLNTFLLIYFNRGNPKKAYYIEISQALFLSLLYLFKVKCVLRKMVSKCDFSHPKRESWSIRTEHCLFSYSRLGYCCFSTSDLTASSKAHCSISYR